MRKFVVTMATVMAALALLASTAFAITGSFSADYEHPFVGLVVFYDENGDFLSRCSGSLLDPTTFLTAGHCTSAGGGAVSARVYFQQDAGANYDPDLWYGNHQGYDPISGYPEFCAAGTEGVSCATSDSLFSYGPGVFPDSRDVGLVILDQPIALSEYGQLPPTGALDGLATARGRNSAVFTVSGYGVTYNSVPWSHAPYASFRSRLMATSKLVNLRSALTSGYFLQTQGNGLDQGGTCEGDSGGPVFLGESTSNLIVALTAYGNNAMCRGTDFAYRIDRQPVLDWINAH